MLSDTCHPAGVTVGHRFLYTCRTAGAKLIYQSLGEAKSVSDALTLRTLTLMVRLETAPTEWD